MIIMESPSDNDNSNCHHHSGSAQVSGGDSNSTQRKLQCLIDCLLGRLIYYWSNSKLFNARHLDLIISIHALLISVKIRNTIALTTRTILRGCSSIRDETRQRRKASKTSFTDTEELRLFTDHYEKIGMSVCLSSWSSSSSFSIILNIIITIMKMIVIVMMVILSMMLNDDDEECWLDQLFKLIPFCGCFYIPLIRYTHHNYFFISLFFRAQQVLDGLKQAHS